MKNVFLTATGAVAILVGLIAPTFAHAVEGRWIESFGQGNYEFFVDKQGLRLYLGCGTEEGSSSYVALIQIDRGLEIPRFMIKVDGLTFDAPFETASRVGSNNYHALLQALRRAPATVIYQGKTVVFPVTGAAKAIPAGVKATICRTF
ncbi:MAG: hypothetical protein PSV40_10350 [Polaromonas sp.]|uniref:hypothetical protein n=1 Tax=Polaromonas sp. TaxID=1869339 RepID=UPI0024898974|nr:hypothetical protein [Polaromonas sp.]MDI1269483.1 hypothetical protein [Polaromonas sp.]